MDCTDSKSVEFFEKSVIPAIQLVAHPPHAYLRERRGD